MTHPLQKFPLWARTLGPTDQVDLQRERLRVTFDKFRDRVAQLVQGLGSEIPGLTVHDITHLDALWRIADQILGGDYPINPAEAFIFGGAVLLHDAAHVVAAFPGGLAEIKKTINWEDLVAQQYGNIEPGPGSIIEKGAIFHILRQLHAEQAHKLPAMTWVIPGTDQKIHLLEDLEIRQYYGDLIGEIAESHHWPIQRVVEVFEKRTVTPPSFLNTNWSVNSLKIALLLRVADAAHLDDQRAPWFLFALGQPHGLSAEHWRFQAKLGQPICDELGHLKITAGAPFSIEEKNAWWLAFDTARMIDKELRDANSVLNEGLQPCFRASSVLGVESSVAFSRYVRVIGWEPIDIAPIISDVPNLIKNLGGSALYGDELSAPLRELLQNAIDAVHAARSLGLHEEDEGSIDLQLTRVSDTEWTLQITDTGIGMSRFVLTNVLLDFGKSLWRSNVLLNELPGLARSGFNPTGKFGIGFYSVFMLASQVIVITRRFERSEADSAEQWQLNFESGLHGRPALTRVAGVDRLNRHGTRILIHIATPKLVRLLATNEAALPFINNSALQEGEYDAQAMVDKLRELVAYLCPASDVALTVRSISGEARTAVKPSDWRSISDADLNARIRGNNIKLFPLYGDDGNVIGRLAPVGRLSFGKKGRIVYNGIGCGKMLGLQGICAAQANNFDARRLTSQVGGSNAHWSAWALRVIEGTEKITNSTYRYLNRLLPEADFPIWQFEKKTLTLKDLVERLDHLDYVVAYEGEISYDDHADSNFSPDDFENYLNILPSIICYPEEVKDEPNNYSPFFEDGDFSWVTRFSKINYKAILIAHVREAWGDVEVQDEDQCVVAELNGGEVQRYAFAIKRVTS